MTKQLIKGDNNMLKTVKSKVIAGVATVGLLTGGGVALGATDAGVQLKGWFDSKFSIATTGVINDTTNYASSKVGGLTAEYNGLKANATSKINDKGKRATTDANNSIDKQSQEYIDQINKEKAHIDTYLSSRFDDLSAAANGLITQSGNDALNYANTDLAKHAGDTGTAAVADVNVKVKEATAQAAKKLQDTIDGAKSDLQGQLNANQAATTAEIKTMIDNKIVELRKIITSTNNQLIAYHEQKITNAADKLLSSGKAELEGIVGNINK